LEAALAKDDNVKKPPEEATKPKDDEKVETLGLIKISEIKSTKKLKPSYSLPKIGLGVRG
jgi:hypothetical protein